VKHKIIIIIAKVNISAIILSTVVWLTHLLPWPVRHHQGGMADVTHKVIHPFILRKTAVATIMAHHKEAPHEEPCCRVVDIT